ncbi:MAG: methionine--tRNA ligase [Candidatus Berkelbacteria bacterium]|nr:methionine--tRNA ligase [Candidatus Berkelbacteria bacterium]
MKYYITTAIDYVNAKPHIGHAFEKVQADVLARYHRALGDDTYFLTGSDENSLKNVQAAKKAGIPINDFVDQNAQYFIDLKKILNLSFDSFIRTTEKRHFDGASKLWSAFKKEDIYKKDYQGFYCVGCEEFKTEKDLVDGCCPEHNTKPELIEEENYFFRLSNYQNELLELIEKNVIEITPDFRKNEIVSFIKGGLEDFSISRSRKRAENWGVPVPGDDDQIMYVWIDALSNYITALDYSTDGELFQKYWVNGDKRIHVIGKGILRFHAVYWPAMLLSSGIFAPLQVASHEYLTINGQKMSKSLGNIIDPDELTNRYGVDATRYLLISALPQNSDGDISWEKMDEKFTSDLANNLGNLVQRAISMMDRYSIKIPRSTSSGEGIDFSIAEEMEKTDTAGALKKIMSLAEIANKYIAEKQPWVLAKEGKTEELTQVLLRVYTDLINIARALLPFMPETAEKMQKQLMTLEPEPLFPRLES